MRKLYPHETFLYLVWKICDLNFTFSPERWSICWPCWVKKDTNLRKTTPAAEQLMLTMQLFRMEKKSVSNIVNETSETIVQVPLHVVGVIDRRHELIKATAKSGNLYHNFKGTFGIVPLAICDVKYHFTLVDVGQYGCNNGSGVLAQLKISWAFENNYPKFARTYNLGHNMLALYNILVQLRFTTSKMKLDI